MAERGAGRKLINAASACPTRSMSAGYGTSSTYQGINETKSNEQLTLY